MLSKWTDAFHIYTSYAGYDSTIREHERLPLLQIEYLVTVQLNEITHVATTKYMLLQASLINRSHSIPLP